MAFSLIRYVSGSRPSILVSGFRQLNFFFPLPVSDGPFGSTDCVLFCRLSPPARFCSGRKFQL